MSVVSRPDQRLLNWLRKHRRMRDVAFLSQNAYFAFVAAASRNRPRSQSPRYFVAALVRVKDEARFLPEWVAYHHALGVEHFYIYNNASSDGTPVTMQPFVDRGIVTLIDWPATPISPSAERHFLATFGTSTEWLAFLDADEFIAENERGEFLALLRRCGDWPAVALNWRYFGSSFHEFVPEGLLIENFTRANAYLNRHVKVVARAREIVRTRNSHNFYYRRGRLARTPSGFRVFASFSDPRHAETVSVTINHYVYRSREDALRKVSRGFVDRQGELDASRRESQVSADFLRNNEVTILPSDHSVSAVKQLLTELGYPREVIIRS